MNGFNGCRDKRKRWNEIVVIFRDDNQIEIGMNRIHTQKRWRCWGASVVITRTLVVAHCYCALSDAVDDGAADEVTNDEVN